MLWRLLERWTLGLLVAYVTAVSVPVSIGSHGTGLDASWMLGLNLAHNQGLLAGRDMVFSYGPLGYLFYPDRVSGTPWLALLFRLGLYALSIAALYRLVWILQSRVAAFWTASILGLAIMLDALPAERPLISLIERLALIALVDRSHWRFAELSALGFLSGLGLLVKLNQGLEGVALFLVVLATVAFQHRPLPRRAKRQALVALCIPPLSMAILYLASTGSFTGIGPYLRNGWQIVSGYSEGTGLPGPFWQAALACATVAATFAAILLAATDLRALWPGLAPALIVAFFAFKHAMVRQDPGHAPAFHIEFAVGLLFLLVCAGAARDRRLIVVFQLFSVALAYTVSVEAYPGLNATIKSRLQLRQARASLAAFWRWPATWEETGAANQRNRAQLLLPDRFHQIVGNGTVDAVPWDIDVVQANGWTWQPRPVFQSYSAYTPALDRLNAAHLESERAAGFVILNFSAIDGHHPFLETPVSWRALLDRYDLNLATPQWLLLQHRLYARYGRLASLGNSTAHWDLDVPVPQSGGLLVMGPHVRQSLQGHALSILFRPAPVYVEAAFSSGRRVSWRSVPSNLDAGFIIRPFPQDLQELRGLFLPEIASSQERIVSVRFHTSGPGEFAPEIPIDWYRLPVKTAAAQDLPRYPLRQDSLTPLWRAGDSPPRPAQAQILTRHNWIEVTPVSDDPQLLFDLGPGLGRFRTLIVRARFEKADRIDAFFGKQVDGRGVNGIVPVTGQWLDVYLNLNQNLF
ncbi:MAG: hypothetical protein ABR987_25050, partial [Terracidiphilus sp.]